MLGLDACDSEQAFSMTRQGSTESCCFYTTVLHESTELKRQKHDTSLRHLSHDTHNNIAVLLQACSAPLLQWLQAPKRKPYRSQATTF